MKDNRYEGDDLKAAKHDDTAAEFNKDRVAIEAAQAAIEEAHERLNAARFWVMGAFIVAILGIAFAGFAVYAAKNPEVDIAGIVQTVRAQLPSEEDLRAELAELRIDTGKSVQKVMEGNPKLVAELTTKIDTGLANRDKVINDLNDKVNKANTQNQTVMDTVKAKLDELQKGLAEIRQPVQVTPPIPAPAPAVVETPTGNQPGNVKVEFVPYDPNRHVYEAPVSTKEPTYSGDGMLVDFDVSTNSDTVKVRGNMVVEARPVVLKDGSRLHDQGFIPKLTDKSLTAYKLDIQMDKEGKIFRTYWFAK